jgi:CRP-like cAMP-binding protein
MELPARAENRLIELLPRRDRRRLLALAEPVQLVLGEVLSEPGQLTSHAYFPVDGFVSMVARVDDHAELEVGMVGREGMLGTHLALGVLHSPVQARVQGPGASWRIGSDVFRAELARCAALRRLVGRYLDVRVAQLASAAACARFHLIGPRLARWLLMSHDRAHSDRFHVTHELVATMLGVRRVGITVAAGVLQRSGSIEYRRGELTVLDRRLLEDMACGCYALDRQAYADRLG